MSINIIVAGPRGKMGTEAVKMIMEENSFNLVACIDHDNNDKTVNGVPVFEDPKKCFEMIDADVFVDLTIPEVGFKHTKLSLEHNIRPVVGTSGFTNEQIDELASLANENNVGCIIAPNFAIGAVLMMKFAKQAAKYFPDIEIIEKHHDQKIDAPSGSALKTVDLIQEVRNPKQQGNPSEYETLQGSRGGDIDGIRIHSVRLPGLVAHQEVIFGGSGQTLTIKHDSLNRHSFMEGIKFSINQVMTLNELVYGLENIVD